MNIPKISTASARNLALSIGLASAITCAACNCNNKNSCDNFEKEKIETVCSEECKGCQPQERWTPWRIALAVMTGICGIPILYIAGYPIYYELKEHFRGKF